MIFPRAFAGEGHFGEPRQLRGDITWEKESMSELPTHWAAEQGLGEGDRVVEGVQKARRLRPRHLLTWLHV